MPEPRLSSGRWICGAACSVSVIVMVELLVWRLAAWGDPSAVMTVLPEWIPE